MPHDVFISHSAEDKEIAAAVYSALESRGVRCWISSRDILAGMDWSEAIIDAIAASRVMVLLLSSNSNVSPHVKREVERAVNKEVIIIPLRIENVTLSKALEYHLSTTHWMDALTPPLERHLQSLAERVKQLLAIHHAAVPENTSPPPQEKPAPLRAPEVRKDAPDKSSQGWEAEVDKEGWVVCPACGGRFNSRDKFFYRSGFHTICTTRVRLLTTETPSKPATPGKPATTGKTVQHPSQIPQRPMRSSYDSIFRA